MKNNTYIEKTKIARLLRDDDTFGSVLEAAFADFWGPECFGWDPLTLKMEIKDDFGINLDDDAYYGTFDKIMAAFDFASSDLGTSDVSHFIRNCYALLGEGSNVPVSKPMDIDDLSWCLVEIFLIMQPQYNGEELSKEIKQYILHTAAWHGLKLLPQIMTAVVQQPELSDTFGEDATALYNLQQRQQEITDGLKRKIILWLEQFDSLSLIQGDKSEAIEAVKKVLALF